MIIEGLTINESEYMLENGDMAKVSVFLYSGKLDPIKILDYAIKIYSNGEKHYNLMDSSLSNPWMRVVLSNINDMYQEPFDNQKISSQLDWIRDKKLQKLL